MTPDKLRKLVGRGLLFFPPTSFDRELYFDEENFRTLVESRADGPISTVFPAAGAGEFFSLTPAESEGIVRATIETVAGRLPVIAPVGHGTATAAETARRAEDAGAAGILVMPPGPKSLEPEGLFLHYSEICGAVGIGIIVYNRDGGVLPPAVVERLADRFENFSGLKDGHGNIEQITDIQTRCGDRLAYIGGMPTAEIYATAYWGLGFHSYSSAVYNFLPLTAARFYDALSSGDSDVVQELLRTIYLPLVSIRNLGRGYAVSLIKAGLRVIGRSAGPVRPPLTDLTAEHESALQDLLETHSRAAEALMVNG